MRERCPIKMRDAVQEEAAGWVIVISSALLLAVGYYALNDPRFNDNDSGGNTQTIEFPANTHQQGDRTNLFASDFRGRLIQASPAVAEGLSQAFKRCGAGPIEISFKRNPVDNSDRKGIVACNQC